MVFILLDLSSLYETLINDLQNNLAFPLNNPMNQSFYFIIIIKVSEVFFHSKWIWLLILEFFSSFHQNTASFFSSYFSMEECCRGCLYKKLILEIKHKCPLLRVVKTWVTKRGSKFIQREPIGSLERKKMLRVYFIVFSCEKNSANFLSNNWYYYFC